MAAREPDMPICNPAAETVSHGSDPGGLLAACIAVAEELIAVLEEETAILKAFDHAGLLNLLPRKEFLITQLEAKMNSLSKLEKGARRNRPDPARDLLKAHIEEIGRINRSNRVFIEGSLSYWQELLDLIYPKTYCPGHESGSKQKPYSPKGLGFSREA